MRAAVVLFTRDLRVRDHPALSTAALEYEYVVPLFVFDPSILARFGAPNRLAFMLEALADLDASLTRLGSRLVVRRGDVVAETIRITMESNAEAVFVAEDVSAYAQRRKRRLRTALAANRVALRTFPGVTVLPPGDLTPAGHDGPFRVFTPYWNRWRVAPRRSVLPAPRRLSTPASVENRVLPDMAELSGSKPAGNVAGGEQEGRARLTRWIRDGVAAYDEARNDLARDSTSGLSPYLHFGCVSPLEVVEQASAAPGGESFARQLCWRDFHHQLLAADPSISGRDLRSRGDSWRDDPDEVAAWEEGRTGYPIVDAGMRQLLGQGTMHNRARLLTASFLTKHLYLDWRLGAAHFARHLVDGDVANNAGNWQWVAGTGADTRPNRMLNPIRQARRFDPDGDYVRRWVPELVGVEGPAVHEPWRVPLALRRGYPPPLVQHEDAVARFRTARGVEPG